MQVTETRFPGLLVLKPRVFVDPRGYFIETWQRERYAQAGMTLDFVQDNVSQSTRGTLRGLHYQLGKPQGKLVRAARGAVYDVVVDMRRSSPTFQQWFGIELNDQEHVQLYVPPGFAHGFCVLSEIAEFSYKCTDYYSPADERTLLWNDPQLNIAWPGEEPRILSGKDERGLPLDQAPTFE